MAVAFDDTAQFDFTGTGSGSSSPIGTPRAVVVLITEIVHASDVISGVTYGGEAMSREVFIARTSGDEDVAVYGYFLGASIPTGNQTVEVTVSSGTTSKTCYIITFTASADTEVAGVGSDQSGTGSPTFTIPTLAGFAGSIAAACSAGLGNCSNVTLPSGYTIAGSCKDYGTFVAKACYDDGLSGADIEVAFSTNADDTAGAGIAIQEVAGGTAHSLAGVAAGTSSSTGAMSLGAVLAGVANGTSTSTGAIGLGFSLAGAADGTSSATGAIGLDFLLAGASNGTSSATGELTLALVLQGVAEGSSVSTGNMTNEWILAGSAIGSSSGSGTLLVVDGDAPTSVASFPVAAILYWMET